MTGVMCGIFLPTTNAFLIMNTLNSHGLTRDMKHKKYVLCFNGKTHLTERSLGSKVSEGFFLAHTRPSYKLCPPYSKGNLKVDVKTKTRGIFVSLAQGH